jgi:carboxylesterase type B
VSINYRLGPFGFLSSGNTELPGNQGIWDQIEALKWVQNNIEFFNGDSNKVKKYLRSLFGVLTETKKSI